MQQFLRKIAMFILAIALASNGSASLSYAKISSTTSDSVLLHEVHDVQHYADLAIEPGEDGDPRAGIIVPSHDSHDNGQCNKCCAACMTASPIPSSSVAFLILSGVREEFSTRRDALVAHLVPTDPGIPKPL